jgi:cell wall-associated NlpC family hydrolase
MGNTVGSSAKRAQFRLADDLLPGDILLSAAESHQSRAIRFGTKGSFSHAAICSGNLQFIEAIGKGVVIFNHGRFGIAKRENVRVLRLDDKDAQKIGQRAAGAAEEYRERDYWTPGAIRSVIRSGSKSAKGAMFCSYLVAQSYADAGVELCPGLPPHVVTPADIEQSPRLKDISNIAIVPLDPWDHRSDLLESTQQQTRFLSLTDARSKVLEGIRKEMKKLNYKIPPTIADAIDIISADENPSRRKAVDTAITKILIKYHYKDLPTRLAPKLDDPADTLKGTPYSEFSIDQLRESIDSHQAMLELWQTRVSGIQSDSAYLKAAKIFIAKLNMYDHYIEYNSAMIKTAEESIKYVDRTIETLRAHIAQRETR